MGNLNQSAPLVKISTDCEPQDKLWKRNENLFWKLVFVLKNQSKYVNFIQETEINVIRPWKDTRLLPGKRKHNIEEWCGNVYFE